MPIQFTQSEEHTRRLLFAPCKTIGELQDWIYVFLDLELPGVHVDPDSNSSPLEMVWDTYSHLVYGGDESVSRVLYYAARFAGKTLSQSVTEVLLLLHSRANVCHLASIEEQSRNAQNYVKKFFGNQYLRNFVEGDNQRTTSTVFYVPSEGDGLYLTKEEFRSLSPDEQQQYKLVSNKTEIIVATMQSVNGKHSGVLQLDELDLLDKPRVLAETVNIPTPFIREDGSTALPLTVLTSTRKTSFGPVQDAINTAAKTGLVVKHFNILDVTERCSVERHRPDLPRMTVYRSDELLSAVSEEKFKTLSKKDQDTYQKEECYHGCMRNCSLFAACRGYLATRQTSTSKFLKPIPYVINQFKDNSLETATSQLLCRKPTTEGLVYPRLDRDKHVLSPVRAYEKITGEVCAKKGMTKVEFCSLIRDKGQWCGGMDFGYGHNFAYVQGIVINNVIYVTHAFAGAELEASQQIDEMEFFKSFDPTIYPDPEDPQMIKTFKKAGFTMKKWSKVAGSVVGGISVMKRKITPTLGRDPEFYLIRDVETDPHIDLLFRHLSEHHWKLDATGKITNQISDTNKDLPDACRYLVMNRFSDGGSIVSTEDYVNTPSLPSVNSDGERVYHQESWMTQKINEITGNSDRAVYAGRAPMVVEDTGGNSYYAQQNKKDKERTGNSKGIIWDFS